MSKTKENKKPSIHDRLREILITLCLSIPVILFLYYVSYYSTDRMMSIISQETSVINTTTKPMKEGIYLTTKQDIEKRGQLIEHKSAVYASDNKKYTTIINEKMIIRFKYSKSLKNNLMETVAFLKDHKTSADCQKSLETTSNYFLNNTNVFMYPNYTKEDIGGGYLYYYQGFIGMNVPTMEFYCKDTLEISKINMIKENFFTDYQLN